MRTLSGHGTQVITAESTPCEWRGAECCRQVPQPPSLPQPSEVGTLNISTVGIKKLSLRQVKSLAPNHMASTRWNWNLGTGLQVLLI